MPNRKPNVKPRPSKLFELKYNPLLDLRDAFWPIPHEKYSNEKKSVHDSISRFVAAQSDARRFIQTQTQRIMDEIMGNVSLMTNFI